MANAKNRPRLDERGLPRHGDRWGENGVVLRGISRGAGVSSIVSNPNARGKPVRILSHVQGLSQFNRNEQDGEGNIFVVSDLPEGEEFVLVVEY